MTSPRCIFAACVATALGCGSSPEPPAVLDAAEPDAPPRDTVMEGVLLVPTELTEGIMTGGSSDIAAIHLVAPTADLDWNIHSHQNGGTQVVHEEYKKMSMDLVFSPAMQADWYLLIRNSGPTDMTIQVKIELYGGMQWRWQ